MNDSKNVFTDGWIPESDERSDFATWCSLDDSEYDEHRQRETTEQPMVVSWKQLQPRVAEQKKVRDALRAQGANFYPWKIAEFFGLEWLDFNQGNRGSCAGCATNNAVNAMLLTHMADGYRFKYKRFNPFPTWDLGKRDANYRGEGASLSMMLTCANRRGMFDVEKAGTYEQSLRTPPAYTQSLLDDAMKCQIAACYLGDYQGEKLARIIFDCAAASYPIVFGNSTAVAQDVRYAGKIKTAVNRGSWMHATARVAYRKKPDGSEYIAHQGSWGKYWEVGKYESEPASVIWESFGTFADACSARYADAFVVCMVEGEWKPCDDMKIVPVKIPG